MHDAVFASAIICMSNGKRSHILLKNILQGWKIRAEISIKEVRF
jgi:hypothetical protein